MEEWRAVSGFSDYEISSLGNIRRDNKLLKPCYDKKRQYGHVVLCKDGIPYTRDVHRLVCEAFIENPEQKPSVDHINRNRKDNRLENLKWATLSEQQLNRKKSDLHNISKHRKSFNVMINRNKITVFRKNFKTLEEAIFQRDAFLSALDQSYNVE